MMRPHPAQSFLSPPDRLRPFLSDDLLGPAEPGPLLRRVRRDNAWPCGERAGAWSGNSRSCATVSSRLTSALARRRRQPLDDAEKLSREFGFRTGARFAA